MKKFGRFLFGSAVLAAAGAGVYYAYRKLTEKPGEEDDDDFLDDLDDYDLDEDVETPKAPEYVSINPEAAAKAADELKEAAQNLAGEAKESVEEAKDAAKDAIDGISKAVSDITE